VNGRNALAIFCLVLGSASLLAGLALGWRVEPASPATAAGKPSAEAPAPPLPRAEPASSSPPPATAPTPRPVAPLEAEVAHLLDGAGASGGVSLIEMGGNGSQSWSLNGDQPFVAASTYKLPLLMEEAQNIAAGRASQSDELCFREEDWEDGYFDDYSPGQCYTRRELDRRTGIYSDNTAAHILVRYEGGAQVLNAYARAHGATESSFYDANVTSSNDLARLWRDEASGNAGGARAQAYLYPLLTNTVDEEGIPAGTPGGAVVHKIGVVNGELNDAALVENGPRGAYVLTVCTDGGSWQLVASVAMAVARFETA